MLLVSLVNDDKKGAISDFRKACDGGNIDGCYNLGLMYAHGDGIK
jgi:TPR repeat protein